MIARGHGCIVDIASVAALAPQPGFVFYNASKAALASASESLRAELRRYGVHVLTVYPGPVHTPMAHANFAVFDPAVARFTPTGDARVLAGLIARAVENKQPRLIYPRIYTLARWLPALARWLSDRMTPAMKRPRTTLAFESVQSGDHE
jgi:short-subunit dehydrogenase